MPVDRLTPPRGGPSGILIYSHGGGLAFSLAKYLSNNSHPMPAALRLTCLWLDLASDSHRTHSDLNDPLIECGKIRDWLVPYIGGGDAFDPLASPVGGDFQDCRPSLRNPPALR